MQNSLLKYDFHCQSNVYSEPFHVNSLHEQSIPQPYKVKMKSLGSV